MDRREKWNRRIFIALLAAVFGYLLIELCWDVDMIAVFVADAEAEDAEGVERWVFCRPDGVVNVRSGPRKGAEEVAWLTSGTEILTDGKVRNGYMHVFGLAAETTEGWISTRYVVEEEPKAVGEEMEIRAEGRVACRKWIDGKIVKWYRDGDQVYVHWMADGWAVTDRGYIRYEYLESLY